MASPQLQIASIASAKAASSLGVSAATLKRWSDQGLLHTVRTPGGHRRITLHSIVELVRSSKKIVIANPQELGLPEGTGEVGARIDEQRDNFGQALESGNESELQRVVVSLFLAGHRLSRICDELIAPEFVRLGVRWLQGLSEVYEEHRACELILRLLSSLRSLLAPPGDSAPRAVGATLPGDPYALPAAMIDLAMLEAGWASSCLGRNLPIDAIIGGVNATNPDLLWLSVSHVRDQDTFFEDYEVLSEHLLNARIPIAVGGRGLTGAMRRLIRYTAFGDCLVHLQEFAESLASRSLRIVTGVKSAETKHEMVEQSNGSRRLFS